MPIFLFCQGVRSQNIDSLSAKLGHVTTDSLKAYVYAELAKGYLNRMDLDLTFNSAQRGMELATRSKDTLALTLNMEYVSQVLYYLGLYEKSLSTCLKVIRYSERLKRRDITARTHRMMGWIDLEMNEFQNGLIHFKKSRDLFRETNAESEDVAIALWGLGEMKYELGNVKEARLYFDSAIRQSPGLKRRERGYVLAEIGNLLREAYHDVGTSEMFLARAKADLQNSLPNRDVYAYVLAELSLTYQAKGNYTVARQLAGEAYTIYSSLPLKRRYVGTYKIIADAFKRLKEFENAFQVEQEILSLSDTIFYHRNQFLMAELKVQYESEKKQADIQLLEQRLKAHALEIQSKERVIFITILSAIVILILVVALVLIRSRYQSKINEIQTQNKIQLEKERIGRDLHDSLGSQLSSISIGLNRLAQSQHIENIQTVVDLADKAVAELRDSLWAMDKESITVSDLEQRIIGLFWQYRKIDVSMELEVRVENELSDVKLASGKAGHLFRIVQEAMHNCIKHSRASYFKINFLREPGFIRVTMKDDGLGFDSQHPQGEHYGLKNIQLRARRINATCTISSAPGKGVKIDLLVPHEKQQIKNL